MEILKHCSLFAGIAEVDYAPMLACLGARRASFEKGETIFAEGDPATHVGIVLSGGVQILQDDYFGNRSLMASIGPAQVFGETFACAGIDRMPVSVIAAEKSSVMLIDCRRITVSCSNACEFHSRMILNLLHVVAGKNLLFSQKIGVMSKKTIREKLMAYLLLQAKKAGSAEFTIPFDRQTLADYIGVERSALSAEISKLRREGILESDRSHFRLLKEVHEDG